MVAGAAAEANAASASAMVCHASSTELTRLIVLARREALQIAHRADEGMGEPAAGERHLLPVLALAGDPEFVGFAFGIVQQQAQLDHGRALITLEAEAGILEFAPEIVVVVDAHRGANTVREIDQRRGPRLRQRGRWVAHRARMYAHGIAQQRADQVEVMD